MDIGKISNDGENHKFIFHSLACLHDDADWKNYDCETEIAQVGLQTQEYLGITIDSKFSWQSQIDNTLKKLRTASVCIYKLKNSPIAGLKNDLPM